jgi:hypothetical protein
LNILGSKTLGLSWVGKHFAVRICTITVSYTGYASSFPFSWRFLASVEPEILPNPELRSLKATKYCLDSLLDFNFTVAALIHFKVPSW